jgi:hypothetical protein
MAVGSIFEAVVRGRARASFFLVQSVLLEEEEEGCSIGALCGLFFKMVDDRF